MKLFSGRPMIRLGAVLFLAMISLTVHGADSPYNKDVQVKTLLRTSTNSAGQTIAYPKDGTPEVSVLMVEIAPGKQTGWHQHPVPIFAYVMEGQVTVELDGGKKHTFRQGEAVAESVNMLHNGVNEGTSPTKLLIFVAGKKDVPFTVKAK